MSFLHKFTFGLLGSEGNGENNNEQQQSPPPAEQPDNSPPPNTQSQDAIRKARVARLEALAQQNSEARSDPTPAQTPQPMEIEKSQKTSPQSPVETSTPPKPSSIPRAIPGAKAESPGKISSSPQQPANLVSPKSSSPNTAGTKRTPTTTPPEKINDILVQKVFGVTLEPEKASNQIFYLSQLNHELGASQRLLNESHVDRIILERFASLPKDKLSYLINCFTSALAQLKLLKADDRKQFVHKLQESIVRYCGLVLASPELFEENPEELALYDEGDARQQLHEEFLKKLSENSNATAQGFLGLFLAQAEEEQIQEIFVPFFSFLMQKVLPTKSVVDIEPHLELWSIMLSFKPLAEIFIHLPNWLGPGPGLTGNVLEVQTPLGQLFSFSALPQGQAVMKIMQTFFQDIDLKSSGQLHSVSTQLRAKSQIIGSYLHQILMSILKFCKDEGKEQVLQWIAAYLNSNRALTKMRYDRALVSSEGSLLNLVNIMLLFCNPIIRSPEQMDKIDAAYLQSGIRIQIDGETKLAVTSEELEAWVDKRNLDNIARWKMQNPGIQFDESQIRKLERAGFTTECFFLCLRAIHLGFLKPANKFVDLIQEIQRVRRELKLFESQPGPVLEDLRGRLKFLTQYSELFSCYLLDPRILVAITNFLLFASTWLLKTVDPQQKGLPLATPSMEYATMPEFILDDIAEFFQFAIRYYPEIISVVSLEKLIPLIIVFAGSPSHVKNPFLRAKLLSVLTELIQVSKPEYVRTIYNIIDQDLFARKFLIGVIMRFYVDVEYTGSHTQFYDKFNTRRDLQVILKYLWSIPRHRDSIIQESKKKESFLPFVNRVLNDGNYLLDEALGKLTLIRALQLQMEDRQTWDALPEATRKEKEKEFESHERVASGMMYLANSTVNMLHYLTEDIVQPFLLPELIDRIAGMLNYFLDQIAGPKCTELKVNNREKYHFDPKLLLGQLVDIYLNFNCDDFAKAVARDGRSYRHQIFLNACGVLTRTQIRNGGVVAKLSEFATKCKQVHEIDQSTEVEWPEEFLDPILNDVMRDPVILPSGITMDRAVIMRHLLNDPTDPFNRQPLSVADLKDNVELKEQIAKFMSDNGLSF